MQELSPELLLLEKQIKVSNPMFTQPSLRRTIEKIIIQTKKLPFMSRVDEHEIDMIIYSIPSEWCIENRIRKDE